MPDNQVSQELIQTIDGRTADSSAGIKSAPKNWPELVFRSPAMLGNTTFAILTVALVFSGLLIGVLAVWAGYGQLLLMNLALLGLGLGSLVLYLLLRTGRVVLKSDKLVEYNQLGFFRTFTYAQIFEVKRGPHADQTWLRYYSMGSNGRIDYACIRGTNLVSVHREPELRHELEQRLTAPPPTLPPRAGLTLSLLALGVLVMAALILLVVFEISRH